MNKVILMGRLVRDPEVRWSTGDKQFCVARYTLACDRRYKREGEPNADYIPCVVYGKSAEFAEKYFRKGTKISVCGHIQTGSYTNKDGQKVYTTEVVIAEQEFAESKSSQQTAEQSAPTPQTQAQPTQAPQPQSQPQQAPQSYQQYAPQPQARPQTPMGYTSYPGQAPGSYAPQQQTMDDFMNLPDGISNEELPFA